jgi:hypothetical protein
MPTVIGHAAYGAFHHRSLMGALPLGRDLVVGLLAQHFCPCTMRSRFSWLKKSPRPT